MTEAVSRRTSSAGSRQLVGTGFSLYLLTIDRLLTIDGLTLGGRVFVYPGALFGRGHRAPRRDLRERAATGDTPLVFDRTDVDGDGIESRRPW